MNVLMSVIKTSSLLVWGLASGTAALAGDEIGRLAAHSDTSLQRDGVYIAKRPERNGLPGVRHYIGDQLKIVFHERLEPVAVDPQNPEPGPAGRVERAELTGIYQVQENGAVVLPMLGSVEVSDQTTAEVEQSLEEAFRSVLGRHADASVLLMEREPIYFLGKGTSAGTVKFAPGMSVLHVIAQAGVLDSTKADAYTRMERAREWERQQKARDRLEMLLSRLVVLRAEMTDEEAKTDSRLSLLVGAGKAKTNIDQEFRRRQVIVDSRKPLLESYKTAIAVAKQKRENLAAKLVIAEASIGEREIRDRAVQSLQNRGSANGFLSAQVKMDLAEVRQRRSDILNDIGTADIEIAQAQKDLARVTTEARVNLDQEIRGIEGDVQELEATLAGTQRVIEEIDTERYAASDVGEGYTLEIIRRTRSGPQRMPADEMTELHPGDLVRALKKPSNNLAQEGKSTKSSR